MAIKVANNKSLSAITSLPAAITSGAMTLLETQTASSSSTISFTSNIDSTYDEYVFKFYDIHPATDVTNFLFQVDTGTNTSYNQTVTNTFFQAYHNEDGNSTGLDYLSSHDEANTTNFIDFCHYIGNGNDECIEGTLHLFDPSNTTFVKHFMSRMNSYNGNDFTSDYISAGYFNTTTALTRVQFKMESGNIDAGVIKLYGIS